MDYRDIEWFALETNRDHSVVFEIVSKGVYLIYIYVQISPCQVIFLQEISKFLFIKPRHSRILYLILMTLNDICINLDEQT